MKDELPEYILDALMRSIDLEDSYAPKQEEPDHIFSLRFRCKMQSLMWRRHGPKPGNPHLTMKNRLIIALLTIILLGALYISSVSGWKLELFKMVEQKFPEYSKLSFMEMTDMDITDDLFCKYAPSYIPKGFDIINSHLTDINYRVMFQNHNNDYIAYIQTKIDHICSTMNTEGCDILKVDLNGNTAYYFENKDIHYLWWFDSKYIFEISSTLYKDDLIFIAKSNKIIEN